MHGPHLLKAYSRTQSNIALSSGEAEYYGLVSTASEALGLVAMTGDFGDKAESFLHADASAAIGVANREGLGRIRHLDTQSLWLQQALVAKADSKEIEILPNAMPKAIIKELNSMVATGALIPEVNASR